MLVKIFLGSVLIRERKKENEDVPFLNRAVPAMVAECALRQEGDVYRSRDETRPPSARRAMFVYESLVFTIDMALLTEGAAL